MAKTKHLISKLSVLERDRLEREALRSQLKM